MIPVIAIDGPSASGKGTITAKVADRLGFWTLDSGALYRLLALRVLEDGIEGADGEAVANCANALAVTFAGDRVLLDGKDVSDAIRDEKVGEMASRIAPHAIVRKSLLGLQRSFARAPGLVADGRDMGTVVFPDAPLKIFLTASAEERASRRYNQLIGKGYGGSLRALLADIRARDERDRTRPVAPLKPADDSVRVDSTHMNIDEVVELVIKYWQESPLRKG